MGLMEVSLNWLASRTLQQCTGLWGRNGRHVETFLLPLKAQLRVRNPSVPGLAGPGDCVPGDGPIALPTQETGAVLATGTALLDPVPQRAWTHQWADRRRDSGQALSQQEAARGKGSTLTKVPAHTDSREMPGARSHCDQEPAKPPGCPCYSGLRIQRTVILNDRRDSRRRQELIWERVKGLFFLWVF